MTVCGTHSSPCDVWAGRFASAPLGSGGGGEGALTLDSSALSQVLERDLGARDAKVSSLEEQLEELRQAAAQHTQTQQDMEAELEMVKAANVRLSADNLRLADVAEEAQHGVGAKEEALRKLTEEVWRVGRE